MVVDNSHKYPHCPRFIAFVPHSVHLSRNLYILHKKLQVLVLISERSSQVTHLAIFNLFADTTGELENVNYAR